MAVHDRVLRPDSERTTVATTKCTKGGCKLDGGRRMPGAGLSRRSPRKAPLGQPAFQPYWGKLAVRNDRGDRGNVGIIRSPIRASILPDRNGRQGNFHRAAMTSVAGQFFTRLRAVRVGVRNDAGRSPINSPRAIPNASFGRGCDSSLQASTSLLSSIRLARQRHHQTTCLRAARILRQSTLSLFPLRIWPLHICHLHSALFIPQGLKLYFLSFCRVRIVFDRAINTLNADFFNARASASKTGF